MSQKRIYDYGDPVTAEDDNLTRRHLNNAGVYTGMDLGVDTSGNLTLAAGAILLPDGFLCVEDDELTLTFSPPGRATNYTVVATHDDRSITGGVEVEYAIQSGLSTTVTDGIPIGWIYHPGGGATLTATMLQDAPKVGEAAATEVDTAPILLQAPFINTYSDTAAMGANVTFTGQTATNVLFDTTYFVVHQKVEKAAGPAASPETLVQHVQFYMDSQRPTSFDFYVNIPGAAQLQLELRDTDLNIVTITGSPISTTTNWEWKSITVDRTDGTFAANSPYELRVTSSVDLNQEIQLAAIRANFYPYPT